MSNYTANDMDVLEGLAPVKKRPGMYIGSTDGDGVRHCFVEIDDNAIDEAISGHCNKIDISVSEDGYITVTDNGRGIPVDINEKTNMCAAILVYGTLHAGGKFENKNYKFSGGLHGVGSSVVNALSSHLELRIKRDGKIHYIEFTDGGKVTSPEPQIIGTCDLSDTGTSVRYKLDGSYFEGAVLANDFEIKKQWLEVYLAERAAITSGVTFTLDYKGEKSVFFSENGISDLLDVPEYSDNATPIMTVPVSHFEEYEYKGLTQIFDPLSNKYLTNEKGEPIKETYRENIEVQFSLFAQDKLAAPKITSFVNNIKTKLHGRHYDGFVNGYGAAVREFAFNRLKINTPINNEDVMAGCQVVLTAMAQDVVFKSQTKDQLMSVKVRTSVERVTKEYFDRWLDRNPKAAKMIADKAVRATRQRESNDRAREEEEKSEQGTLGENLTGVLTNCQSKKLVDNELFIVEGDSAGGTAKQARCKKTQAILPLRGKILNTYKKELSKSLKSQQIRILATAIGTGLGDDFDYSKLRFGKIIPLTDADVDGSHIQLLFVAFMYKYMPELIKKGHLFIAETPLYRLEKKGAKRNVKYIKNDEELNLLYPTGTPSGWEKSRFKGLGEMNPPQLKETAMNPDTRTLRQVVFREDKVETYKQIFDDLMGDDPSRRFEFITQNVNFID